jgi:hypothetical protein
MFRNYVDDAIGFGAACQRRHKLGASLERAFPQRPAQVE